MFGFKFGFGYGFGLSTYKPSITYQWSDNIFKYQTLQEDSLGSELFLDPYINNSSLWGTPTPSVGTMSISGGKMILDGAGGDNVTYRLLDSSSIDYNSLDIGYYEIIISDYVEGGIDILAGNVIAAYNISGNGTHTGYFNFSGNGADGIRTSGSVTTLNVESISIKEVLATKGTNLLDNQGTTGTTNDGLCYAGNPLYVGSGNEFDVPLEYTLGSELVLNGDFSTSDLTRWEIQTAGSTIQIVSDTLQVTNTSTTGRASYVPDGLVIGNRYMVEFDAWYNTGGQDHIRCEVRDGGSFPRTTFFLSTTSSKVRFFFTATASTATISTHRDTSIVGDGIYYVDNFSVSEITYTTQQLVFSDVNTGASYIGQGSNGAGSNISINGTFDDNTGWGESTIDSNNYAIVENGKAHVKSDGTYVGMNYGLTGLVVGRTYAVRYNSTVITNKSRIYLNSPLTNHYSTSSGTYTFSFVATSTSTGFYIQRDGTCEFYIDNIEIYEVIDGDITYTSPQGTFDYVARLDTALSTADKALPDLGYQLIQCATGNTHDLSIEQADVTALYVPNTAQGRYLQNIVEPLGSEAVLESSFESSVKWVEGPGHTISDGKLSINSAGTNDITYQGNVLTPNTYYLLTIDYSITSGTSTLVFGIGGNLYYPYHLGSRNQIIVKSGYNANVDIRNGYGTFTADIYSLSLKAIEVITIPNYSQTTNYDNTDFNQKGVQTLPLVIDGTGRVTDIDYSKLHFRGDLFYADTQWIPSDTSDFTIHIGCNIDGDTSTVTQTMIGGGRTRMTYRSDVNRVYAYFFNIALQHNSPIVGSDVLYSMSYDATNKNIYLYENGILKASLLGITPSPLPYSMFIGAKNLSGVPYEQFIGNIGHTQILESYSEQTDITSAYNTWAGI